MDDKRTNLLLEGVDSIEGYQAELINRILHKTPVCHCVCVTKDHDGKDRYDETRVTEINYDICEHNRYAEVYDFNDMLPLGKDILEAMLPYESTVMKMLVRNTEQDVYFYDESKRFYLAHLRFWNHIFRKHQITHVVQVCVPHHAHDYVIYALAKIYRCKYVVNVATSIWNHWIPCTNLEYPCEQLLNRYEALKEEGKEVVLSEKLEHYYQALHIDKVALDRNIMNAGMTRKQHIDMQKNKYLFYFNAGNRLKRRKHLLKEKMLACMKHDKVFSERIHDEAMWNTNLTKRSKLRSKLMVDIHYYDSLATQSVEGERYVVYFLHYQPEASTLPQAGVFVEQELAITLLAHVLKQRGIRLYVKEHFVQPYRSKAFYDGLKRIDNVTLINSNVDSKQLLVKSLAVSSCCGSSTQEAIFNGVPVLLFGFGMFTGAPGTFSCATEQDIVNAMDRIQNGMEISQEDVRYYLKAFDELAVRTNPYVSSKAGADNLFEECGINNLEKEIIDFVREI